MRAKGDENTPSQLHKKIMPKNSRMEDGDEMPDHLENETTGEISRRSLSTSDSHSISPPPVLSPAFSKNGSAEPVASQTEENREEKEVEDVEMIEESTVIEEGNEITGIKKEEEEEEEEEEEMEEVTEKGGRKVKEEEEEEDDVDDAEEEEKLHPVKKDKKKKSSLPKKKNSSSTKKKAKSTTPTRIFDFNAPKSFKTAYVFFIMSRRKSLASNNMAPTAIYTALAAEWKSMSAEDRKPFDLLAEADRKRRDEEMEIYKKTPQYAEFQKRKEKHAKNRKRKAADSDDDEKPSAIQVFPSTSAFCPLLNNGSSSSAASSSSFTGQIFNPEFITYNKARDSYRRQMTMERSNIEHELEALKKHDPENRVQNQKEQIKELDKKLDYIMKTMSTALGTVNAAQSHLSNPTKLTSWLQTVSGYSPNHSTKKAVREAVTKFCAKKPAKK